MEHQGQAKTSESGHYVVLAHLVEARSIRVGALGEIHFQAGCYAYAGSALRCLPARLKRHLSPPAPRLHWHIDRFMAVADPIGAVWAAAESGRECEIAVFLGETFPVIPRFGSSDCRCRGHMFYARDVGSLAARAEVAFRHLNRRPERLWFESGS
jgi:Uri superfamily endonuclease